MGKRERSLKFKFLCSKLKLVGLRKEERREKQRRWSANNPSYYINKYIIHCTGYVPSKSKRLGDCWIEESE